MSKKQIRVLWCLENWKAMCIWTGRDHGSFGRGCNARGVDWLSLSLWEHTIFFCSFVSPTSPMPNDIWKHVTHRKTDPVLALLARKAMASYEKPTAASLYLSPSERPRQFCSFPPTLYMLSSELSCQKLISHTRVLAESSCLTCI